MGRTQPFRLCSDLSLAATLLQAGWLLHAKRARKLLCVSTKHSFSFAAASPKSHLHLGTSPLKYPL